MADQQIDYEKMTGMIATATGGKGIKGFAKKLTYAIIILITLVGTVGSFTFIPLDMDAFAKFIPVLALFVIPLILSIGANSIAGKIKEKDVEKEQIKIDGVIKVNEKKITEEAVG